LHDELTGIPGEYIREALDGLSAMNLLIEGTGLPSKNDTPASLFLARHDLVYEGTRKGPTARARLEKGSVEILTARSALDWFAAPVAQLLKASGIANVAISEYQPGCKHLGQTAKLVLYEQIESSVQVRTTMYVGVGRHPSTLLVGPITRSKIDGCLECADLNMASSRPVDCSYSSSDIRLAVSLIAWEAVDVIIRSPSALGGSRLREYDLRTISQETWYFPCHQLAGKPRHLRESARSTSAPVDAASVYNDRVSSELEHTISFAWQGVRPFVPSSDFAVARRQDLPRTVCELSALATEILFLQSKLRRGPLTLAGLAALCSFGVGVREYGSSVARRWVPSAGNFGSASLHTLTSGLDQLERGLYSYDAVSHSLVNRQTRSSCRVEDLIREITGARASSDRILLVVTARQDLLMPKYRDFSYKLVQLDAGVVLAQVGFVAAALGMRYRVLHSWPDGLLGQELNLPKGAENVAIIIEISRTGYGVLHRSAEKTFHNPDSYHKPEFFRGLSMADLTKVLQDEAIFVSGEGGTGGPRRPAPEQLVDAATLMKLPSLPRSAMSVATVLDSRKSVRTFSPSPTSLSSLHAVLSAAWMNDREEWKLAHKLRIHLNFTVLRQVSDEGRFSVYRYAPAYGALEKLHEEVDDAAVREMFVQEEFVHAPTSIFISAHIAQAVACFGPAAYKLLLVRAGAAGHRMWLTGLALGMEGTLVAGLRTRGVRAQIEKDYEGLSPLLACCLGKRPAGESTGNRIPK
jgi:SagB-type dehydrogenase family enzyme